MLNLLRSSRLPKAMAESSPTYVSQLVKHMKCLTEVDEDTLLDLALDNVAESVAEKLALKQGNNCSIPIGKSKENLSTQLP